MFSWFGKKKDPGTGPGNPGTGTTANIAFKSEGRAWNEEVDLLRVMERVLTGRGHAVNASEAELELADSGLILRPQFVALQPLNSGGVRTVTTVEVAHPDAIPGGIFEYQHAGGADVTEAIADGFDQWAQTDLVALLDALKPKPESCTMLEMEFPATDGKPAMRRRAVLGPVAHMIANPPPYANVEEHPFCPCCLLTNSFEAFKTLVEADQFYGLRLFAARDDSAKASADCRVNGEDWKPGAKALCKYVQKWPGDGFEFRKQYVILQTVPAGASK